MALAVDLTGQRVLVTGAAGGIGAAVGATAVEAGATVILSDHDVDGLRRTVDGLRREGGDAHALPADLVDDAADLPERVVAEHGGLDGLVNAAGIMTTTPFPDVTRAEWDRIVAVNLTALFAITQAACAVMVRSGGGAVVSLASVAGRSARPNAAPYAATKAGVISVTRSAAAAYAPTVRVNAVCPGQIRTPMWTAIIAERDEKLGPGAGLEYFEAVRTAAPLGRAGEPGEVATVVAFLLSGLASFMTGQSLNVCGGLEMD